MLKRPLSRRQLFQRVMGAGRAGAKPARPLPFTEHVQGIPTLNLNDWTLAVGGLVTAPLSFTHDDLQGSSRARADVLLVCVANSASNQRMMSACWSGIRLTDILESSAVKPEAQFIQFYGADGYTTYLPIHLADQIILADHCDGELLTLAQGYPFRLIAPGLYGYKLPKWITRIALVESPLTGYWESRGMPASGQLATSAFILSPAHRQSVPMQPLVLAGVAYTGTDSIDQVEIAIDDGDWMPVRLDSPAQSAVHWQTTWLPPAPGDYAIRIRATDSAGVTSSASADANRSGFTRVHSLIVRVQA